MNKWATTYPLTQLDGLHWYGDRLVVMEDSSLKRGVISLYHNSITAGHPRISNTMWAITRDFWWPMMKKDVTEYIKGCNTCQSRKNQPNQPKPPLFPITSDTYDTPFTSIAMDFIIKLPLSESYDTILTITDTFSKASIFIPCNETINAEQTAKLYATYILPHYRLPTCIISDQDPRFHISLLQRTLPYFGNSAKHQHCLSSSNKWTVRTHQSTTGTVPLHLHQLPPTKLGLTSPPSTVHTKCMAQCNNKESTL